MLEILLLIFLTRKVGEIVEAKGHKPGWYKLMTVLLWIGGEVSGAVAGGVVSALTGAGTGFVYLFALLGAAAGTCVAFVVAKTRSPRVVAYDQPPQPPTFDRPQPPTFNTTMR